LLCLADAAIGQKENMDLIEKNPAAFINPHQPLMTSITGRFISAIFNTVLLYSIYVFGAFVVWRISVLYI
jgi:hypothetical protein